jgi:hypothetical protein
LLYRTNRIRYWIWKNIYGRPVADDLKPGQIFHQNPKLGECVKLPWGFFSTREAIFKERPLEERFSENEFRYFFEFIDGSLINVLGDIPYISTDNIHFDYRDLGKNEIQN